eukprot:scpid104365/ scgid7354/ 
MHTLVLRLFPQRGAVVSVKTFHLHLHRLKETKTKLRKSAKRSPESLDAYLNSVFSLHSGAATSAAQEEEESGEQPGEASGSVTSASSLPESDLEEWPQVIIISDDDDVEDG